LMSFPPGTEMFQFPGFASTPYVFRCRYPHGWVSPFGNPRINDRSHLPAAYRSVPRPSSPLGAKASTERSYRAHQNHTCPHAGPSPTHVSVQPKLSMPSYYYQSLHLFTPHPSQPAARAADQPRHVVTNPIHLSNNTAAPLRPLLGICAGQRNLSCRGTCAPSRQGARLAPDLTPPRGKPSTTQFTQYGDGRYRTDGPLLAKQVLYH
jgi:hypothetical protein